MDDCAVNIFRLYLCHHRTSYF